MKKVNLLLFYIFFIIYEELVLSCLLFRSFPITIWLIGIFSVPIAILFSFISNIFKEKINKIITYIITIFTIILFGAQVVYYCMYESILSFYSIVNGGQVAEFMDVIIDMIIRNWYAIVLLALPIIALIILNLNEGISYERMSLKGNLIKFLLLIVVQIVAIFCVDSINTNKLYSNKNLYHNIHFPKLTTKNMGFLTTLRLDLKRFIFGFEENVETTQ